MNKNYFLSRADVAADVRGAKMHRHMAVYARFMWRMCVSVCACAHVFRRVCTHVCACVISEIAPFSRFLITHYWYITYIPVGLLLFFVM